MVEMVIILIFLMMSLLFMAHSLITFWLKKDLNFFVAITHIAMLSITVVLLSVIMIDLP